MPTIPDYLYWMTKRYPFGKALDYQWLYKCQVYC